MKPFLALLLTFSFAATSLLAQTTKTQTIKGKVIDHVTGQPLAGAIVLIKDSYPSIGAYTDQNGEYRIPRVLTGKYALQCSFLGYQMEVEKNLRLNNLEELKVDFKLTSYCDKEKNYSIKSEKASELYSFSCEND